MVLTILHCGIHPVCSAPAILSWFNEMVLTIPYPPCPYLRPRLGTPCSQSYSGFVPDLRDGAHNSPPPPLYLPGFTRRCSLFQPYSPYLSSPLDVHILRVRFSQCNLQIHPCQVGIAPPSSKCASHSGVQVSSKSTSLLQVHPPPPRSPPCPECCLSPPSALLASGGDQKMKFPLPGPLCKAHSAFPSLLAATKPMLYWLDSIQNVTAPAFVPVVWRAVGGQCVLDGVACRLWYQQNVNQSGSNTQTS